MCIKELLVPLFIELEQKGVQYAVCGNYENLPDYTSHDVDFWTDDPATFEDILFNVAKQQGFNLYLHNKTANGSNNFFYRKINDNMHIVRIDILVETAYLSFIPLVRSKWIEKNGRTKYKGFYVVKPAIEAAMHLLYPLLYLGRVKDKYRDKIYSYADNPKFRNIIEESLGYGVTKKLIVRIKSKDWKAIEKDFRLYRQYAVVNSLMKDKMIFIKKFYNFIQTNVSRIFSPPGLFVVFIGPDGCGKTTLVNRIARRFDKCFTSGYTLKFYWRPFLLPRMLALVPFGKKLKIHSATIEGKGLETQAKEKSLFYSVLSFIKFIYYVLDFIAGRIKYLPALSRGGLVLFDRYYYDNVVYPERFGFWVPDWLMKVFRPLIPEPDLVFFLQTPPEGLLSRKQEMPIQMIISQQEKYLEVVRTLKSAFVIDTNKPVEDVELEVMRICFNYMSERLRYGR